MHSVQQYLLLATHPKVFALSHIYPYITFGTFTNMALADPPKTYLHIFPYFWFTLNSAGFLPVPSGVRFLPLAHPVSQQ